MPKQFDLFSRCFKPKDTSDFERVLKREPKLEEGFYLQGI